MDRWNGRVALVTGGSEGIGREIALTLARSGMKVIICARNETKLQVSCIFKFNSLLLIFM